YRHCDPPEVAVQRAKSRIGDPYDLWNYNCEHFAAWCKTGRHDSPQINSAWPLISGVLGSLSACFLCFFVLYYFGSVGLDDRGLLSAIKVLGFGYNVVGVGLMLIIPTVSGATAGFISWREWNRSLKRGVLLKGALWGIGLAGSGFLLVWFLGKCIA